MENVRKNTMKCQFDRLAPRPSAADVHEWLTTKLQITVDQVDTLQLDGYQHAVFIKFISQSVLEKFLRKFEGQTVMQLFTGQSVNVAISAAGVECTYVRIFNLPPEVSNDAIGAAFAQYGKVKDIKDEHWSKLYKCNVKNGIRAVEVQLKMQIPSVIRIAGFRVQIVYDGQQKTCTICNSNLHMRNECNQRLFSMRVRSKITESHTLDEGHADAVEPVDDQLAVASSEIVDVHSPDQNTMEVVLNEDTSTVVSDERSESEGVSAGRPDVQPVSNVNKAAEPLAGSAGGENQLELATSTEGTMASKVVNTKAGAPIEAGSNRESALKAKTVRTNTESKIGPYHKDPRLRRHNSVEKLNAPVSLGDYPALKVLLPSKTLKKDPAAQIK